MLNARLQGSEALNKKEIVERLDACRYFEERPSDILLGVVASGRRESGGFRAEGPSCIGCHGEVREEKLERDVPEEEGRWNDC